MASLLGLLRKAPNKLYGHILRRIDPARYISRYLQIRCRDPRNIHLYGRIDFGSEPWILTFGENVYITDGVKFITHDGGTLLFRGKIPDLEITKPITLGNHVYIGNNALIMPGVSVGDWCIIAAGAVVTKDVPSGEVWGGVPARFIETSVSYLSKVDRQSLHLGHLKDKEKDLALRKYYGID